MPPPALPCSNSRTANIHAARAYRSLRNLQDDLADMVARFHVLVRCIGFFEREDLIDHRPQPAALDIAPDGPRNLVGDHGLELDRAGAKRRSGPRQPPPQEVEDL